MVLQRNMGGVLLAVITLLTPLVSGCGQDENPF